ncbi:RING-H2 finger protein ATL74-like [Phragmites australis]|uniref:RING-H2 finger protein ATL74-like n=1 Tax=Phragmites australis TaxID=29695 RepID=UPI002D79B0C1|nr:RING-H2 finger protein ATL74-like [Phragmites australis]
MEVGGALAPVLFAAFSLPCLLLLLVLGEAGFRIAALALRGGQAWPTRCALLGYRIARPGGSSYSSVFREDDEPPLPRECCDRLAVAVYRGEHAGPDPECVFCLSAIRDGEEVRELRCRHVFHRACLDAWLVRPRATCPLCRDRLLPSDPPRSCGAADDVDLSSSSSAAAEAAVSAYAHGGALWHMT